METTDRTFRKRCKRYNVDGQAHYLTFSCFRRQPFLTGPRACAWLARAIDSARMRHEFDLWGFVFMPEHVHLLLLPQAGVTISSILKEIKQPVAVEAVRYVKAVCPQFLGRMADRQANGRRSHRFWQRGGGYDRNIWSPREIHEKLVYIHANPVRRGLVESPGDWPWSSWGAWETGIDDPLRVDRDSLPPLEL